MAGDLRRHSPQPISRQGASAADGAKGDCRMKVTVNIDCTPLEARQFFGLPMSSRCRRLSWMRWRSA